MDEGIGDALECFDAVG